MALIPRVPGAAPLLFVGLGVLVAALPLLTTDRWKGDVTSAGPDCGLEEAWRQNRPNAGRRHAP